MGPLDGIRIIEMAGIGPAPLAGMILADLGAEVVIVERPGGMGPIGLPKCSRRGKKSLVLNLKDPKAVGALKRMIKKADVIFEGYRPGVMEKLSLGPEECLEINPGLVYGRMTGWGQEGPLARSAGHDINYISLNGALHAIGRKGEKPCPPLNLVGDFGGGSLFLVVGILSALLNSRKTGKGQVVDAAMTDGSAILMAMINSLHAMGIWNLRRGENLLDSGAPYYDSYETKDNKYISIGAIEPHFFKLLLNKLRLDSSWLQYQNDRDKWPELRQLLSSTFLSKTREEWCDILEGSDVCFAPILDLVEARQHPHNVQRKSYIELDGMTQPAPAPRFSQTPTSIRHGSMSPGQNTIEILSEWGCTEDEIMDLGNAGGLN